MSVQSDGTDPSPRGGPRRRQLGGTQKELAGRFYQLLSGHASIGFFLHRRGTVDDDTCWLCDTGQRQTRFHLVARCPTLRGQQRVLWRRVERLCDWDEPRAREVRLLFDDVRAAPAVLTFPPLRPPTAFGERWRFLFPFSFCPSFSLFLC